MFMGGVAYIINLALSEVEVLLRFIDWLMLSMRLTEPIWKFILVNPKNVFEVTLFIAYNACYNKH